jgi:predicted MFS family arabinose efflux permease
MSVRDTCLAADRHRGLHLAPRADRDWFLTIAIRPPGPSLTQPGMLISMNKGLLYLCITIGGIIGGYIPVLFGAGGLSLISIVGSTIGGFAGIWLAYRIDNG